MQTTLLIIATLLSVVAGNILLKLGALETSEKTFVQTLLHWQIALGIMIFGAGAIFYMMLLKRIPLNVAQSVLVGQFVGVILASYFILHEPLSALRLVGIALITIGIAVVVMSST